MPRNQKKISAKRILNSKLTSYLSISLVLFLVGLMLFLSFEANHLSTYVKENIGVTAILKGEYSENVYMNLQKKLSNEGWAKEIKYTSKENALKKVIEELGEDPTDFLGYNPAFASFDIYINSKFSEPENIEKIVNRLKREKGISEVIYHKNLITSVNNNIKKLNLILSGGCIILLLISYTLIRNTVRLLIYSKRFLIRTMQLVGAKNSFIMKPFIISNIWGSLFAVLLSCLFMGFLYYFLKMEGIAIAPDIITYSSIFVVLLILSILITSTATFIAVNKYLKMTTSDLYYI